MNWAFQALLIFDHASLHVFVQCDLAHVVMDKQTQYCTQQNLSSSRWTHMMVQGGHPVSDSEGVQSSVRLLMDGPQAWQHNHVRLPERNPASASADPQETHAGILLNALICSPGHMEEAAILWVWGGLERKRFLDGFWGFILWHASAVACGGFRRSCSYIPERPQTISLRSS